MLDHGVCKALGAQFSLSADSPCRTGKLSVGGMMGGQEEITMLGVPVNSSSHFESFCSRSTHSYSEVV